MNPQTKADASGDSVRDAAAPVDFAILTAIGVEKEAVCAAFGLGDAHREKRDGSWYWRGRVSLKSGGAYEIVVAQPVDMGNVDAALLASEVIRHWHPRAALMVGIAATAEPNKVRLGDVVGGNSVWYYEHGKVTPEGIKPEPDMVQADPDLLKHLVGIAKWDGCVPVPRPDGTNDRSQFHRGVIASGEKVVADTAFRDQIARGHRKIQAIEMEGYGFSRAVRNNSERVRHLVIRGMCDEASSKKDDRWHSYAAAAAANFAKHFLMDRPLEPRTGPGTPGASLKPTEGSIPHLGKSLGIGQRVASNALTRTRAQRFLIWAWVAAVAIFLVAGASLTLFLMRDDSDEADVSSEIAPLDWGPGSANCPTTDLLVLVGGCGPQQRRTLEWLRQELNVLRHEGITCLANMPDFVLGTEAKEGVGTKNWYLNIYDSTTGQRIRNIWINKYGDGTLVITELPASLQSCSIDLAYNKKAEWLIVHRGTTELNYEVIH